MRLLTIALLVMTACPLLADKPTTKEAKNDLSTLDGKWEPVGGEKDGRKVNLADLKGFTMTFQGQSLRIWAGGPRALSIKLDQDKTPKAMDLTSLDGNEKGRTSAAIYALEKGELKFCMAYQKNFTVRPTEFKTQAGDGRLLLVLKRVSNHR